MTARYAEAIAGLVLVAFAAFALQQTMAIAGPARIFPLFTVIGLGVFSLIYFARSLLAPKETEPLITDGKVFAIVLGLALIYVNLAVAIGYVTSTLFYIPLTCWLIGFRRPVYIALVTIIYLTTVTVLFEVIFNRALPRELLFDLVRGAF